MNEMEEKTNFTVFAEDSDFHGVRQVTRANNGVPRRILWGLMLAVALGVLVYNTTQQVINFFKYDHITKLDITFVHELVFPALTICNVNKHRRTALTPRDILVMGPHLGMTDQYINLTHPEVYPENWARTMFEGTDWAALNETYKGQEYDLEDFYERTAHKFKDMVQYCRWEGNTCEDESWEEDYTHYSKCYTFNKAGDHPLKKAGSANGLQVVLYDESDEYIETDDSEDLGFKFLPHSPEEPPFLKEMGFGLAPGFHYLIALQQREIKGLGNPYTECEEDHKTEYYSNYSVPACRIECETELIYEECGCKLVESPGTHPVCTDKEYDCAENMLLEIEQSDMCLCQNPCHAIQYPFRMSFLELREATVEKLRKEHPIPNSLTAKDLVVLTVYFDALSYELIEQVPAYTWLDILSDFGGSMGLWLGASVLATIQLIDYLFLFCATKCQSKQVKPVNYNGQNNAHA